jgi:hypothetical protein
VLWKIGWLLADQLAGNESFVIRADLPLAGAIDSGQRLVNCRAIALLDQFELRSRMTARPSSGANHVGML